MMYIILMCRPAKMQTFLLADLQNFLMLGSLPSLNPPNPQSPVWMPEIAFQQIVLSTNSVNP